MVDLNRNAHTPYGAGTVGDVTGLIDQGLRSYMLSVYNYMVFALAVTGAAALGTFLLAVTHDPGAAAAQVREGVYLTSFGYALFVSPLKWALMLSPLAVVFLLSARIGSMSVGAAQATFWLFSALMGMSLSTIFLVFTGESIVRVFFITAAAFGGLSLYGYTTRRSLSAMGSFLVMGLFGLIIASLVNIFLGSTMLQFVISCVSVLVFAGLTAYDTQRIKDMYDVQDDGTMSGRKAIMGALALYLDFINLFTALLQLLGNRN